MPSHEIKIVSTSAVTDWIIKNNYYRNNMSVPILLGGDRISCCDEAAAIFVDGVMAGVATIAFKGESGHGLPDIVGVFIAPKYRGKQLGVPLFEAAVRRCLEKGYALIHVDVMSSAMKKTIERMDESLLKNLDVMHHDFDGRYTLDCP